MRTRCPIQRLLVGLLRKGAEQTGDEDAMGHTHTSERPSRTCDEHNLARCLEVRIGWFEGGVELSVHGFGELKRFGEKVHVE